MTQPNNQPKLVVFAGPNGSGKSTITSTFRESADFPANYINPDEIALTLTEENPKRRAYQAAIQAEEQRQSYINQRESFAFETVMSHPSKLSVMKQAKNAGYLVELVFVATSDPEINIDRVRQRVAEGGHDVPVDKIRERYHRTIELLPASVEIADRVYVFDNSQFPQRVARFVDGELTYETETKPEWAQIIINQVAERAIEKNAVATFAAQSQINLTVASIDDDVYVGIVNQTTNNYIVQQIGDNLILHDRSIVKEEFTPFQNIRIAYRDGNVAATVQPNQENQEWAQSILRTASGIFETALATNRITNPSRGVEVVEGNTYNLQVNRNTRTLSIISKSDSREVAVYDLQGSAVIASNPTLQDKQYWQTLTQQLQSDQQLNSPNRLDIEL
jgi:predicted ABC-type ATPase